MAVLISCATGNWLTAGTWALVDSTSYANSETTTATPPSSAGATARSSTFTPGAITIDAIAIKIGTSSNTTGTLTANIYNNTDVADVAGTSVTINKSDLNRTNSTFVDGGWLTFKFASPVTLIAAKAYAVQLVASNITGITVFASAGNNWSRALRTTTTQAPVAGDDMIVAGEHTGAGTGNNLTVTMNETATTDYGSNTTSTVTPALAVCKRGTLKFNDGSAANPKLRLSGHAIVYNGGTLNIGTVATPMPRDSTAVLEFDCAADGDFGLVCRNSSNITLQGLSRTSGKNIMACKLAADASASGGAPSTSTLTIDSDTGWLSGDQIAIAATSRTASDCETGTLNADAGASSLVVTNMTAGAAGTAVPPTSNRGLLVAHSGTSPTQAEIIMLTRNVKVRSTSATAMSYVFIDCQASGTTAIDINWTEFYYLGENATNKRGLEVNYLPGFAGLVNIQYSSFHDCEDLGVYFSSDILNTTFSSNVMWNLATVLGPACQIAGSSATTNHVMDSNILIRTLNGNGWTLADIGGTFTNNIVVGTTSIGLSLAQSASVIGTMTGNIVHSTASTGVAVSNAGISGTLQCSSWRNSLFGINIIVSTCDLLLDNVICFGNAGGNISAAGTDVWLKSPILNGDTTFSTPAGITYATAGSVSSLLMDNGDFSSVSGIKTAHSTADINISATSVNLQAVLRDTKLGAATEIASQSNLAGTGYISSQKHDQIAGNHKTWLRNGTIQSDATTFNTTAPSMLMMPTSSTLKLESAPQFQGLKIAVNNGTSATVSCYVKKLAENLFTYSADFTNAVWSAPLGLTATAGQSDPLGGTGATKYLETSANSAHLLARNTSITVTSGVTYTCSCYVKAEGAKQWIRIYDGFSFNWFDILNGVTGTAAAGRTLAITPVGAFYRISITFTPSASSCGPQIAGATADNSTANYVGNTSNGFTLFGWQIELGSAVSAYQATTVTNQPGYNGSQPRLIQKANPALGQDADVVLATLVGGTGSWIQMSGTTSAATDEGAWEIVVDCDGTVGTVNIDDFTVS